MKDGVRKVPSAPAYSVSMSGVVYSTFGKPMSKSIDKRGYVRLGFHIGGKTHNRYVHQIVAETFIGPRPDGMHINHIDGNKQNNHVSNLEYVTPSQNRLHALRMGLAESPCGEDHGRSKITESDVIDIHLRRQAGETLESIGDDYGIVYQHVHGITTGRFWPHVEVPKIGWEM